MIPEHPLKSFEIFRSHCVKKKTFKNMSSFFWDTWYITWDCTRNSETLSEEVINRWEQLKKAI